MSDVLLCQTNDDGDIEIEGGLVTLTDDFRTAAYLSMFGGNENDDGRDDNPLTWWGNLNEDDPAGQYVGETDYQLRTLPVTTGNLLRVEDAASRDLEMFQNVGAVKDLKVTASLVGLNKVKFEISLDGDETVTFFKNWQAQAEL